MSSSAPRSPLTWANYAKSPEIKSIPLQNHEELDQRKGKQVTRAVYLQHPACVKGGYHDVKLFAEAISLEPQTVIDLEKARETLLCARVLASEQDVHLDFIWPANSDKDSILTIFATQLDHQLSYSVRDSSYSGTLQWGPDSSAYKDRVGVQLYFDKDRAKPKVTFLKNYQDASPSSQFKASLETQLRAASILFLAEPSMASRQAAYIAHTSAKLVAGQQPMNIQAVQLGQQLSATALAGPNMNYAPVLTMSMYEATATAFIKAAEKYETEFERFSDQAKATAERLQAWTNMMDREVELAKMRKAATARAKAKYEDASKVVDTMRTKLRDDTALRDARSKLKVGIKAWQIDAKLKAAFQIISAVFDFASSIGLMCLGSVPKIPVGDVVEAVKAVDKAAAGVKLSADTLETLRKCVDSINKLWDSVKQASESINLVEDGRVDDVTTISDVNEGGAAADTGAVGAVAAWDKWILDSDEQLEFPVSQGIAGASEYRLELRKRAIDSKTLIQAKVETIKAGQEYLAARLDQSLAEFDLKKLGEMKQHWSENKEVEQQAAALFYDRLLSVRTSIVMEMRDILWAYKYNALEDSKVRLSVLKKASDYRLDMATILQENETYLKTYGRPYRIQDVVQKVIDLPDLYRHDFVQSLKTKPHTATVAFTPSISQSKASPDGPSGPFTDGEHFRINSLRVYLVGAVPKPRGSSDPRGALQLRISTSGVYADVRKGHIFNFVTKPIREAHFNYTEESRGRVIKEDAFDQGLEGSMNFVPPTPFTQWTVSIKNADELNLEGLTDVEFHWNGLAYNFSSQKDCSFERMEPGC